MKADHAEEKFSRLCNFCAVTVCCLYCCSMLYLSKAPRMTFRRLFNTAEQSTTHPPLPLKPSEHLSDYLEFVGDVDEQVSAKVRYIVHANQLEDINIVDTQHKESWREVSVERVERRGAVVTYKVRIGCFEMPCVLLHAKYSVMNSPNQYLSMGAYGVIIPLAGSDSDCVAKRIACRSKLKVSSSSTPNPEQIEEVLLEYAFYRVCSALGIGPKVRIRPSFDVICFSDCLQFSMEKCEPLATGLLRADKVERRLKYCMRLLHSFQLIHKDLKPANIVYSRRSQELVLVDFGVSCAISSPLGFKSLTYREGTERFMSQEMINLPNQMKGFVDLYWNDAAALKIVLDRIRLGRISRMGNFPIVMSTFAIAQGRMLRLVYSSYAKQEYEGDDKPALDLACGKYSQYFPELARQNSVPIKSWDIELVLRTFGDADGLVGFLQCNPSEVEGTYTIKSHPYQPLLVQLFPVDNLLLQRSASNLTLLKLLTAQPQLALRTTFSTKRVLLELADLAVSLNSPTQAIGYLLQASKGLSEVELYVYKFLIGVLNGKKGEEDKELALLSSEQRSDILVESAFLHFHFGRYEQASNLLESLFQTKIPLGSTSPRNKSRIVAKQLLAATNQNIAVLRWTTLLKFYLCELYKLGLTEELFTTCQEMLSDSQYHSGRNTVMMFKGLAFLQQRSLASALETFIQLGSDRVDPSTTSIEGCELALLAAFSIQGPNPQQRLQSVQLFERMAELLAGQPHQLICSEHYIGHLSMLAQIPLALRIAQESRAIFASISHSRGSQQFYHRLSSHLNVVKILQIAYNTFTLRPDDAELFESILPQLQTLHHNSEVYVTSSKLEVVRALLRHYYLMGKITLAAQISRTLLTALIGYLCERKQGQLKQLDLEKFLLHPVDAENLIYRVLVECQPMFQGQATQWFLANLIFRRDYQAIRLILHTKSVRNLLEGLSNVSPPDNLSLMILNEEGEKQLSFELYELSNVKVPLDMLYLAVTAFQIKNYQKSCLYLRLILEEKKEAKDEIVASALYYLADSLRMMGQLDKDTRSFYLRSARIMQQIPANDVPGRYKIGYCYYYAQQYKVALAWLGTIAKSLVKEGNQDMLTKILLAATMKLTGMCYCRLKRYRQARGCFMSSFTNMYARLNSTEQLACFVESLFRTKDRRRFWRYVWRLVKSDKEARHLPQLKQLMIKQKDTETLRLVFSDEYNIAPKKENSPLQTSLQSKVWNKRVLRKLKHLGKPTRPYTS